MAKSDEPLLISELRRMTRAVEVARLARRKAKKEYTRADQRLKDAQAHLRAFIKANAVNQSSAPKCEAADLGDHILGTNKKCPECHAANAFLTPGF